MQEPTEEEEPIVKKFKREVIKADSSNGDHSYYTVRNSVIETPKLVYLTLSHGPDFSVYYFKYPAGISFGIFFGDYPDLPACISNYTKKQYVFAGFRDPILAKLNQEGFYTSTCDETYPYPYTNSKDFQLQQSRVDLLKVPYEYWKKFYYTDTLTLEVEKYDSTILWTSFPKNKKYGKVDVLVEDMRSPYFSKIHVFGNSNSYLSRKMLSDVAKKLIVKQ
jgi:hypothetical protein